MKVTYDAKTDRAEISLGEDRLIIWKHHKGSFVIFADGGELRITPLMRSHILVSIVAESEEDA